MRFFKRQKTKLWAVLVIGLAACMVGIAYAVVYGRVEDGSRGGAFAVALAFFVLFTSTPSIITLIEARDDNDKPDFHKLPQNQQIERLHTAIAIMLDTQRVENIFLALTSVIGTLVWGFGDLIAAWLRAHLCLIP